MFSANIAGMNESALLYNTFVLQLVSDYIWENNQPYPDWGFLDVDALQHDLVRGKLDLDDVSADNFNVTVTAFYTWMVRKGFLSIDSAVDIVERLRAYQSDNALHQMLLSA
jgi:hypothetical protein